MQSINLCGQKTIENSAIYCGIASTADGIYLSAPMHREIHHYDENLEFLHRHHSAMQIGSFCYDESEGCYWAIACSELGCVLKLDRCFKLMTKIVVRDGRASCLKLQGVAVKDARSLVICGIFGMAEIEKNTAVATVFANDILQNTATLATEYCKHRYLSAVSDKSVQSICCGFFTACECVQSTLPCDYNIRDISAKNKDEGIFYTLATKNYNQNILVYGEIANATAKTATQNSQRDQLGSVIKSIASIEESLAEILSAESQKIKKILTCSDSCSDIIRINDSVNKTIAQITQLEQVLCSKMHMTQEFYSELGASATTLLDFQNNEN